MRAPFVIWAAWLCSLWRLAAAEVEFVTLEEHRVHATRILAKTRPGVRTDAALAQSSMLRLKKAGQFTLVPGLMVLELDEGPAPVRKNAQDQAARLRQGIEALRQTGLYEYVEPDYVAQARRIPNDSKFSDGTLWGLRNTGQEGGVAGADIGAEAAWDLSTGSTEVIVAVIDSGIRYTHQELAAQMWRNPGEIAGNGVDDDADGHVDNVFGINAASGSGDPLDDDGHGTHLAGIIGAGASDGYPIVGVAWQVRLMACKFLRADGFGTMSDAIRCISFAVQEGAKIINASWGTESYSQALFDAVLAASHQGVLLITAAGNDFLDNDEFPSYPANFDLENVVSVTALDRADDLWFFSNTGLGTVDLGAPGAEIYSAWKGSNSDYKNGDGTSLATAYVTGVAALVRARFPGIGYLELRDRLLNTVEPVDALQNLTVTGGRLNAQRALSAQVDGNLDLHISTPTVSPLRAGQPVTFFVRVTDLSGISQATVTGSITQQAAFSFKNDGTAPDRKGNDAIYSAVFTVPAGTTSLTLTVTATAAGKNAATRTVTYPVVAPPPNDHFAAGISMAGASARVTGSNVAATVEPGEPEHAGKLGGQSVWWKWTAPAHGLVLVRTEGSDFDTLLAVYTGNSVASLTHVASNDDTEDDVTSAVVFNAVAGTTYHVAVDGFAGDSGNVILDLGPPPAPPLQRWSFPTSNAIWGSPALAEDGTIYVGTVSTEHDGRRLYAIHPNGSLKWQVPMPSGFYSSPAVAADGTIYLASVNGKLHAFSPDGAKQWEFATGASSTPAIGSDGTVYVGSPDGKLHAIQPNGNLKWSYATGFKTDTAPALAADGTIYVISGDVSSAGDKFHALHSDGSLKWTYPAGGQNSSPAIASDGTIYFGADDNKLYALNPNGSKKWEVSNLLLLSPPSIGPDGTVYVGGIFWMYAVSPAGFIQWSYPAGGTIYSAPAVAADGTIYFGVLSLSRGKILALRSNGSKKWEVSRDTFVRASPTIGFDGTVYFGTGEYFNQAEEMGLIAFSGEAGPAPSSWPMFQRDARHTGNATSSASNPPAPAFQNGNFESPSLASGAVQSLASGSSSLTGWSVETSASVALANGPYLTVAPASGFQHLVFKAAGGSAGGSLSQSFHTLPGQLYIVACQIARATPGGGPLILQTEVRSSAGATLGSWTAVAPESAAYGPTLRFSFTAATTVSTLSFVDVSGARSAGDLLLDAVSVSLETSQLLPLSHWKFDSVSEVICHDSAGAFHGALSTTGARIVASGISGGALSLDRGSNGFVNLGNVMALGQRDFSVVAWVKTSAGDTASNAILLSKHHSGTQHGYFLNLNRSGVLGQENKANFFAGDTTRSLASTTDVNDGNWHQIAGVYQPGGNTLIYVDGAPAEGSIPSWPVQPSSAPFLIGGVTVNGAPAGSFTGLIDDVQVYDRALTPLEIDYLYLNPGRAVPRLAIFTEPRGQTVLAGQQAALTVGVLALPPIAYQWRLGNQDIPGATNASFILTNAQTSHAGHYSVTVRSTYGSLTSQAATLSVIEPNKPPAISVIANQTAFAGRTSSPVAFTVSDAETASENLSVTAASSNPALVPKAAVALAGAGVQRLAFITPIAGQTGTAVITLTVSDGQATAESSFTVTVVPAPAQVILSPFADTSLIERSPGNNLGGLDYLLAGSDAAGRRSRALVKFDVAARIPANAAILSALVKVNVTGALTNPAPSTLQLHRALVDWGEGGKTGPTGQPATPDEATWNERRASSSPWNTAGSAAATDYAEEASGTLTMVSKLGEHEFVAESRLLEDVQRWAREPETNFGWLLISSSPASARTERRLASRESASDGPRLFVEFTVPSGTNSPPTLSQVRDQTAEAGENLASQVFLVNDRETSSEELTVTAATSNPALIPLEGVALTGSGAQRSVMVTPAAGQTGQAVITLTVTDGSGLTGARSFRVTVRPPGVAFEMSSASGVPGTEAVLPLRVRRFAELASFQFSLHWDPAVLQFQGVEDLGVPGLSAGNFNNAETANGTLSVAWDDPAGAGVSLTNETTAFALRFQVTGAKGSATPVIIDGTPVAMKAENAALQAVPVLPRGGQLTVQLPQVRLDGRIRYYAGDLAVPGVALDLNGEISLRQSFGVEGTFGFDLNAGESYALSPSKEEGESASRGVTTLDITLIRRHVLAIQPFSSGFAVLAADVNGSSSVTTLDVTLIRRLILGKETNYPGGSLWRFVRSDVQFSDPLSPWSAAASRQLAEVSANLTGQDFFGIKLGDVNGSWSPASAGLQSIERGSSEREVSKQSGAIRAETDPPGRPSLKVRPSRWAHRPGARVQASVEASGLEWLTTAQFTLRWDSAALRFAGWSERELSGVDADNFGLDRVDEGELTFSWDDRQGTGALMTAGMELFAMEFEAREPNGSQTMITWSDEPTLREVTAGFRIAQMNYEPGLVHVGGEHSEGPGERPELSFTRGDGLTLRGTKGSRYRIEYTDDLGGPGSWRELRIIVLGGAEATLPLSELLGPAKRFYRALRVH